MTRTLSALGALLSLLFAVLGTAALGGAAPPDSPHVGRYAHYAVAADHPVASQVGAHILATGGTAADAAAATMLALGVVSPASSGFGGGGFALYYRASDQSLTFLDFRETAPAAATPDMYEGREPAPGPIAAASQYGGLASGVPGEPAGVAALVERFGRLPLSRVVQPSLRLARQGVAVSPNLASISARFESQLRADPVTRAWLPPGGGGLVEGQRLRRPALARALAVFARDGAAGIYRGPIAEAMVRDNRAAGGVMSMADLHNYRVVEREPIVGEHFGHRFVTAPPPSAGGFTMLQSLAILERIDPERRLPTWAAHHALAESWKGPFFDRQHYFGDPDYVSVPLGQLMADRRLDQRARVHQRDRAVAPEAYALPIEPLSETRQGEGGGTSHLCVVDAEGNVASVTTTVNLPFGARYTAAGVVMNDQMDDFARAVGEANAFGLIGGARNLPAPGKRPVSTMSPTIVFDAQGPALCVGAAGGSRIVTATQQVALGVLVDGLTAEWAMERPRIHHQASPDVLYSEDIAPLSPDAIEYLTRLGHAHATTRNIAVVQLIQLRRGPNGGLVAVSDPRKGGRPAGR